MSLQPRSMRLLVVATLALGLAACVVEPNLESQVAAVGVPVAFSGFGVAGGSVTLTAAAPIPIVPGVMTEELGQTPIAPNGTWAFTAQTDNLKPGIWYCDNHNGQQLQSLLVFATMRWVDAQGQPQTQVLGHAGNLQAITMRIFANQPSACSQGG